MSSAGNVLVTLLTVSFALYGIVMLVRKVNARKDKNPSGQWRYYVEPYEAPKSNTGLIGGTIVAIVILGAIFYGYNHLLSKRMSIADIRQQL